MHTQSSESVKQVSSKNKLCSKYSMPKSCTDAIKPHVGCRCACMNLRCGGHMRMEAIEGIELVPAGGEYLQMS